MPAGCLAPTVPFLVHLSSYKSGCYDLYLTEEDAKQHREGEQVALGHREGGLPATLTPRALGMCTWAKLQTPDISLVNILSCPPGVHPRMDGGLWNRIWGTCSLAPTWFL